MNRSTSGDDGAVVQKGSNGSPINHVQYFATFCVVSGTYITIGLTIAWCRSFLIFA